MIGAIAQLVEQRTENPCVPGSIPGGTTSLERLILGFGSVRTESILKGKGLLFVIFTSVEITWCHSSVGRATD